MNTKKFNNKKELTNTCSKKKDHSIEEIIIQEEEKIILKLFFENKTNWKKIKKFFDNKNEKKLKKQIFLILKRAIKNSCQYIGVKKKSIFLKEISFKVFLFFVKTEEIQIDMRNFGKEKNRYNFFNFEIINIFDFIEKFTFFNFNQKNKKIDLKEKFIVRKILEYLKNLNPKEIKKNKNCNYLKKKNYFSGKYFQKKKFKIQKNFNVLLSNKKNGISKNKMTFFIPKKEKILKNDEIKNILNEKFLENRNNFNFDLNERILSIDLSCIEKNDIENFIDSENSDFENFEKVHSS